MSTLAPERIRSGLRNSIYDGIFASIFGNLTASMFLPAYALAIGASALHIGILAAAPFFAAVMQMPGAYLVERYNKRKQLCILFAFLSRISWLVIIAASLTLGPHDAQALLRLLILFVIVQHIFGAMSGVSWLSWMAALVPESIRGRYFGLRNMVLGFFTVAFTLLAGRFLDLYQRWYPHQSTLRKFEWIFALAVLAGMVSLVFLARQPAPPTGVYPVKLQPHDIYKRPLQQPMFRRLLLFAATWSIFVKLAGPFFIVYMLKPLQFDYSFVAILSVCTAVADMYGMLVWGNISDRFGNKSVMAITGFWIGLIPLFWLLTYPDMPGLKPMVVVLHLISGFFWAGFNLCSVNMVFSIAPPERNSGYFAYWSAVNGIASGIGAVLGGVIANSSTLSLANEPEFNFKAIFLLSGIFRLASLLLLKAVKDDKSMKTMRVIRILMNIKAWSGLMGFNASLHFFMPGRTAPATESSYWPIWECARRRARSRERAENV